MSESNFDEQLDRVLRHRAQAEVPLSLEERIQTMLTQKRMRITRETWWIASMAACVLLGVFVLHRFAPVSRTPQTAGRESQSLVQATSNMAHANEPEISRVARTKSDVTAGQRQLETTHVAYSPLNVGIDFHMPPATSRIAEHTAACALIPCSCPEMCRTSN